MVSFRLVLKLISFILMSLLMETVLLYVCLIADTMFFYTVYLFSFIELVMVSLLFKKEHRFVKAILVMILMTLFLIEHAIFYVCHTRLHYSDDGAKLLLCFLSYLSTFVPFIAYIVSCCIEYMIKKLLTPKLIEVSWYHFFIIWSGVVAILVAFSFVI